MTAALLAVYVVGALVTAPIAWRFWTSALGPMPGDERRTVECALFWPIGLPFIAYFWKRIVK